MYQADRSGDAIESGEGVKLPSVHGAGACRGTGEGRNKQILPTIQILKVF